MKQILFFVFVCLLAQAALAQQPAANGGMVKKTAVSNKQQSAEFKVLGNCSMCKKTIEKAATGAGAAFADWNEDTDLMTVRFDAGKTSVDAIQKAIAQAGYDNAGYKGNDEAYSKLHSCCQYDRTGAAGGTKTCTENK